MPRIVQNNFSRGMITDSIAEEGAVAYLQDMYLRKKGELICRGPVYANQFGEIATPSTKYTVGFGAAQFHPNIGLAACRGMHSTWDTTSNLNTAQKYQLIGAGLGSVSRNDTPQEGLSITWQTISEGTDNAQCCHSVSGTMVNVEKCYQSFNTGSEMIFVGELGHIYKWGGSFAASYNTGTVTITAAGEVTGSGSQTWLTSCEVGQYILIDGIAENSTSTEQRAFRITSIQSNTKLTIETAVAVNATARSYRIQRLAVVQSPAGVWNKQNEKPFSVGVAAYHNSQLWVAGVSDADSYYNSVFDFDKVRFSGNPGERGTSTTIDYGHMDLWDPQGSLPVMPGVGGFIRGLVSMNGVLMVIKSHGLFKISGESDYDANSGRSYSVQVESSTIGASGFSAWKNTPAGLILANENGLFLYDGDSLKSVSSGRIDRLWESFANYVDDMVVNTFGSLVVVGSSQYPDLPCIIWDFEQDYFWIGTNMSFQSIVSVYNDADLLVGFIGLAGHVMNMPQQTISGTTTARVKEIPTSDLSSINHWNTGPAGTDMDASGVNVGPAPIIATHPFMLYPEGPGDGRVNNVGMTMYSDRRTALVLRPGESGVDQVLYSEHQSDGTDFSNNSSVNSLETSRWGDMVWGTDPYGASVSVGSSSHGGFVEEEIPLTSEIGDYTGGYKNVRIPVDSFPSTPFVSAVFLASQNQFLDMTSYQVRIQAIYIDYEPTSNFGTI